MADYYAVLQRTLSGFADPKPELRIKLYERARGTIERQLQTRTPPVEGLALDAELQKLEQAIIETERGFNQSDAAEPTPPAPPPPPAPELLPTPQEAPAIPIFSAPQAPIEQIAEPIPVQETAPAPIPEPVAPPIPVIEPVAEPVMEQPIAADPVPAAPIAPPVSEAPTAPPAQPMSVTDPVEEWAKEFLSNEPNGTNEAAPVIPQQVPQLEETPVVASPPVPQVHDVSQIPPAGGPSHVPQVAETLPTFSPAVDDDLSIPPAPGYSSRAPRKPKKRGFLRWILLLLLLIGLGFAGFYGWQSRNMLIDTLGLQSWFDDPTRPKPVKTITIKPDPIKPEAKAPATKSETRIDANSTNSSDSLTANGKVVTPPIAQNAILYEVGGTAADNSVDAGRVVWSVIQEEPLAGLPKEPAIRARVEIPSRKVVLIMTIKRNGDKSVPASHLIEFVFAVPDDFSGGGIGNIQSPRFKEQERSEGAELVGVPIEVSNGIFMVALNNLETAVKQNQSLMKDRNWIDIPMIYRTGRRASMSIEKGQPGAKAFDEVFTAWEKL